MTSDFERRPCIDIRRRMILEKLLASRYGRGMRDGRPLLILNKLTRLRKSYFILHFVHQSLVHEQKEKRKRNSSSFHFDFLTSFDRLTMLTEYSKSDAKKHPLSMLATLFDRFAQFRILSVNSSSILFCRREVKFRDIRRFNPISEEKR